MKNVSQFVLAYILHRVSLDILPLKPGNKHFRHDDFNPLL